MKTCIYIYIYIYNTLHADLAWSSFSVTNVSIGTTFAFIVPSSSKACVGESKLHKKHNEITPKKHENHLRYMRSLPKTTIRSHLRKKRSHISNNRITHCLASRWDQGRHCNHRVSPWPGRHHGLETELHLDKPFKKAIPWSHTHTYVQ